MKLCFDPYASKLIHVGEYSSKYLICKYFTKSTTVMDIAPVRWTELCYCVGCIIWESVFLKIRKKPMSSHIAKPISYSRSQKILMSTKVKILFFRRGKKSQSSSKIPTLISGCSVVKQRPLRKETFKMGVVTLPTTLQMLEILDFCHQTRKLGWCKTLWSTSQTFLWQKGHEIAVNSFVLEL